MNNNRRVSIDTGRVARLMVIVGATVSVIIGASIIGGCDSAAVAGTDLDATAVIGRPIDGAGQAQPQGQGQGQGYGRAGAPGGGAGAAATGGDAPRRGPAVPTGTATPSAVDHLATFQAAVDALPRGSVNAQIIARLMYSWELEKAARDLATTFAEQHGLPIFTNVARAQQTHMDQLAYLIARYELTLPSAAAAGGYRSAEIRTIYDRAVAAGAADLNAAARAALELETATGADLTATMELTTNADLLYVYEQVLAGAENHQLVFERQIR